MHLLDQPNTVHAAAVDEVLAPGELVSVWSRVSAQLPKQRQPVWLREPARAEGGAVVVDTESGELEFVVSGRC